MKLRLILSLLCIGFTSFLSGCGQVPASYFDQFNQPESRPTNLPRVTVSTSSIQGNWYSDCRVDAIRSNAWVRETLSIYGSASTSYAAIFEDSECRTELFKITTNASFSLSGENLNATNSVVSVSATRQSVVDGFNLARFCGVSNWQTGFPMSFANVSDCGIDRTETKTVENYGNQQLFVVTSRATVKYIKQ
jgi:hypothetical protein